MKDELRSESQAEICGGGKIRKNPFFCPVYLSAILPLGLEPWSAIKASQTGANGNGVKTGLPSWGEDSNQGPSHRVTVCRSDFGSLDSS
jgi:hypothetical protein